MFEHAFFDNLIKQFQLTFKIRSVQIYFHIYKFKYNTLYLLLQSSFLIFSLIEINFFINIYI